MRGISEAELWMHRNNDRLDWDTRRAFDIVMRICPPKELTPWMPIAEAPKDRPILLRVSGFAIEGIAEYGMSNSWLITLVTKQQVRTTHYQELPE